jgi:hypothetical protein
MPKHSHSILALAKKGAAHRYRELKAELTGLVKAFPHLRYGSAVSPAMPDAVEEPLIRRRRVRTAAHNEVGTPRKPPRGKNKGKAR